MTIIYVGAIILLVYAVALSYMKFKLFKARKKGDYPEKGNIVEDDIKRLVSDGQTTIAVRAYRELHACGLIEAKHAVNAMKRQQNPTN